MRADLIASIADCLVDAYHRRSQVEPITDGDPAFDLATAYAVQRAIHERRLASGWEAVGRKVGFTNRELWPRYGVDGPLWAHMYAETVQRAPNGRATVRVGEFVQARIEPEVVFGLDGPVPAEGDSRAILECVDWIAAGFEIVQCHFPDWKFRAPDCTAAFGLHAGLVIGPVRPVDARERDRLAERLSGFELVLYRDGAPLDRGTGDQVLGSPALVLRYLARLLAEQPAAAALRAGEIVTTGTLTDAWPIAAGQRWRSDYGALDLAPIELEVTS